MTIDTQKLRDQAQDGIAEALGDAYDCMCVWSAWGVGTMGPDDFALVTDDSDRLLEITDAALSPVLPIIDAQSAEIARLRHALDLAEKALLEVEPLVGGGDDEINLEPAILTARAALSGEGK